MTNPKKTWFTVAPLMGALTTWARRIITGADNGTENVDELVTPIEEDEEIIVRPIEYL